MPFIAIVRAHFQDFFFLNSHIENSHIEDAIYYFFPESKAENFQLMMENLKMGNLAEIQEKLQGSW